MGGSPAASHGQLPKQQRDFHGDNSTHVPAFQRILDDRQQVNFRQLMGVQNENRRKHEVKPFLRGILRFALHAHLYVHGVLRRPKNHHIHCAGGDVGATWIRSDSR